MRWISSNCGQSNATEKYFFPSPLTKVFLRAGISSFHHQYLQNVPYLNLLTGAFQHFDPVTAENALLIRTIALSNRARSISAPVNIVDSDDDLSYPKGRSMPWEVLLAGVENLLSPKFISEFQQVARR